MDGIDPRLLETPVARAAYSDRTAWLMAELSRLAYTPFDAVDNLVMSLAGTSDPSTIRKTLLDHKHLLDSIQTEGQKELARELDLYGLELIRTFDRHGTQAFLAKRPGTGIAVLSFRGTEPKQVQDILADVDARLKVYDSVRVHSGFVRAYGNIADQIRHALMELDYSELYITGHSLGGALALIATRDLRSDTIAACYTFGGPRVGESKFADAVKAPIYRVVHGADAVPGLPPSMFWDVCDFGLWLFPIWKLTAALRSVVAKFKGYVHHGDMRYVTSCKPDMSDLRLVYNPEFLPKWRAIFSRWRTNRGAGVRDHSIQTYCDKLRAYATRRLDLQ